MAGVLIESVAKAHHIPCQRLLLDRGACEASAVQAHGLPAAGLSILLTHYHNCGEGNRLEPEKIEIEDALNLVKLLVALLAGDPPPDPHARLRDRIGELAKKHAVHEQQARAAWG